MKPNIYILGALAATFAFCLAAGPAAGQNAARTGNTPNDRVNQKAGTDAIRNGQLIFRYDTFGDELFWRGTRLHEAILGAGQGGVGAGISPRTALGLGLKVDSDRIPGGIVNGLRNGTVNLDDPAVTVELLRRNAVVGVIGFFNMTGVDVSRSAFFNRTGAAASSNSAIRSNLFRNRTGALTAVGITCALCHSTVDDSVTPGVGHRLDGWANRDLNVGAIIASAPDLSAFTTLLDASDALVRQVLGAWGPGKFDAELILDGKSFTPDGRTAATLIPAAYGLAGFNVHTWTDFGNVTYWNAFVATNEMHGLGKFFDPRLADATRFPVSARNRLWDVDNEPDLITPKLADLHVYQLSLPAPAPPAGSFDADAAARGEALFTGKANCDRCHKPPLFTEPGYNTHRGEDIGIDNFQADRSPGGRYKTMGLKGIWAHQKGGFYHDGRFATLLEVVDHYDTALTLGLTDAEKDDLVQYLLSLSDPVQNVFTNRTGG